jgi:hypothetical protein
MAVDDKDSELDEWKRWTALAHTVDDDEWRAAFKALNQAIANRGRAEWLADPVYHAALAKLRELTKRHAHPRIGDRVTWLVDGIRCPAVVVKPDQFSGIPEVTVFPPDNEGIRRADALAAELKKRPQS